jgi:lipoprotein-anchoring transpeptidase ErfK/SrfK
MNIEALSKRALLCLVAVYYAILIVPTPAMAKKSQAISNTNPVFVEEVQAVEDPSAVSLEEAQQIVQGPNIIINAAARKLYLYNKGELVKVYPIAVGSSRYRTPIGKREMNNIIWNPWWIPPKTSEWAEGSSDTPPGPNNPLGPVKMKLGSAIMIHGTSSPQSIGKAASHGCMRMFSDDARDLAKYLQLHMTDKNDPSFFAQVKAKSRRSFHVKLETKIPVNIVYELASLENNKLYVYRDVYYKGTNKLAFVKNLLKENGYNLDKVNWDMVSQQLKLSTKKDVSFNIAEITKKQPRQVARNQVKPSLGKL